MFADYYSILGIDSSATLLAINEAYRNQSKIWHPDINPSPEAKARMQGINEAIRILRDPEAKTRYDLEYKTFLNEKESIHKATYNTGGSDSESQDSANRNYWYTPRDEDLKNWMDLAKSQSSEYVELLFREVREISKVAGKAAFREFKIQSMVVLFATLISAIVLYFTNTKDNANQYKSVPLENTRKFQEPPQIENDTNSTTSIPPDSKLFVYNGAISIYIPSQFSDQTRQYHQEGFDIYNIAPSDTAGILDKSEVALQIAGKSDVDSIGFPIYASIIFSKDVDKSGISNFSEYNQPHLMNQLDKVTYDKIMNLTNGFPIVVSGWKKVNIVNIKGYYAIKISMFRKFGNHSKIKVESYTFLINGIDYRIQLSFPIQDSLEWSSRFNEAIQTVKFMK